MADKNFTPVRQIAASLSTRDLALCAKDVLAWRKSGLLPDVSPLRSLAGRLQLEAGQDDRSALQQAEDAVLREIAIRFVAAAEAAPDVLAPKPLHPEQLAGEIHLCNLDPDAVRQVGWKSKRAGVTAYRADGSPDPSKVPLFVSYEEFRAAGQWDSRYTVKE